MSNNYLLKEIIHASDKPTQNYFGIHQAADQRKQVATDNQYRNRMADMRERETQLARNTENEQRIFSQAVQIAMTDPSLGVAHLKREGARLGLQPIANEEQFGKILESIAKAQNLASGRSGVHGTPIYGTDDRGNPTVMFAERGTGNLVAGNMPEGYAVSPNTKPIDTGSKYVYVDPRNPNAPIAEYEKELAPNQTPEHRRDVKTAEEEAKRDIEKRAAWPKARDFYKAEKESAAFMSETIDRAIALSESAAGYMTAGKVFPESEAGELSDLLQTIKANIGFSYLQDIKRSSPTGGGVGSLSEREFENLAATAGSLRQTQKPETLARTLAVLKRRRAALMQRLEEGIQEDFADFIEPQTTGRNFENDYGIE